MLTVSRIANAAEFAARADLWNELVDASPEGSFFETSEWISSWLEAFWIGRGIEILLVHEGSRLVGAAPLLEDDEGEVGCSRTLTLPRNAQVPHVGLVAAAGRRYDVVDAVFRHLASTRATVTVTFGDLEQDSASQSKTFESLHRNGLAWLAWPAAIIPRVSIEGGWDAYVLGRDPRVRHELRRKMRNMEKAGRVEWRVASTGEDCARMLPDVFGVEARSWKHAGGTSLLAEAGVGPLYDSVARRAADRGWLRLHVLYLDGAPVAHLYGIVYKNEYLALKTSYDESARNHSPGAAIVAHALRDAFEQGFDAFDFLGVQTRWKSELATDVRRWSRVCVFSRNAVRCRLCRVYQNDLKPFVRSHLDPVLAVRRRLRSMQPPPAEQPFQTPRFPRVDVRSHRVIQVAAFVGDDPAREACEAELIGQRLLTLPNRRSWDAVCGGTSSTLLVVREAGRCIFGFAAREYRSRALPGHAVLRAERVAIPPDPDAVRAGTEALVDLARSRHHVIGVSLAAYATDEARLGIAEEACRAAGLAEQSSGRTYADTILIDLVPGLDEIRRGFGRTARRNARGYARHPVSIRDIPVGHGSRVNDLLRESMRRTGGRFRPLDLAAITALETREPSAVRAIGLYYGETNAPETLLSFAIGLNHGDVVEYADAGSTRRPDRTLPLSHGLVWKLVAWARASGARWFDFGGVTDGTRFDGDPCGGISEFKRSFSTNQVRVGREWMLDIHPGRAAVTRALRTAVAQVHDLVATGRPS